MRWLIILLRQLLGVGMVLLGGLLLIFALIAYSHDHPLIAVISTAAGALLIGIAQSRG